MIAREGWPSIIGAFFIGLTLSGILLIMPGVPQWIEAAMVPLFLPGLGLMTVYFFRDPDREVPLNTESLILAPSDGKIVEIIKEKEPLFINDQVWRISIFLSVLDVHVNRVPACGKVTYLAYKQGEFRVAWHPKSSTLNEQSQIGIEHPSGNRILFKQIAGRLARRIVYRLSEGDQVRAGERFGLIRFGSRMDVLIPSDISIEVKVGDRVSAGMSVLGVI
ncbi:MAG: phosphatidylserine decarboxylase family protein [Bacteroidetes bacterium]|nr:phosphatidylserine decarboxylase family protein [Bacteroidota bacterium]